MEFIRLLKKLPNGLVPALLGSFLLCGCGDDRLAAGYSADESVTFGITSRIPGFDPAKSDSVSGALAVSKVYEGLLQYDYLARPYKVIPLLSDGMPEVSEDRTVYTFKIRKGIFFADDPCFSGGKGREIVAEDFVYSFKRIADVKNSSTGYWTISRIKGINDFSSASGGASPTNYDLEVEGLTALDSNTFQIKLTEPYPQFLYVLTMQYLFVVPHEAVSYYKKDFVNHPVGTGPYRLLEWNRNSRVEFARNPKWEESGRTKEFPSTASQEQIERGLGKDAGKPLPTIDRIVQFVVDDQSTAWMLFLKGELDVSGISRDNFDAVISGDKKLNGALEGRGIKLITYPSLDIRYIGFNMDDPVVGYSRDPKVNERHRKLRQALSCAYNFDEMNTFQNDRLCLATGPVPQGLAGHLDEASPYGFNLEKANRLLAEAGYPNGIDSKTGKRLHLTMEVGSANDTSVRQRMQVLRAMYDRINVVLDISSNNWPAFLEKINRRQSQLFELGWTSDYPDAESFLQLFYSGNVSPGPNHSNYCSSEFDELYEQVRVMDDSPERTELYKKMARIIIEDCPWVFEFQSKGFALVHSWVENYEPHDFPYGMGMYRNIDVEKRARWIKQYRHKILDMSGRE